MAFAPPEQPISLPLPHPEAYPGEPREYARALMQRKDQIDEQIDALNDVLASHNAGGDTPLVDPEGYPRGDIDVYTIRHTRAALARLRTDRDEVQHRLTGALEAAFQPGHPVTPFGASNSQPNGASRSTSSTAPQANGYRETGPFLGDMPSVWPDTPVARVNSVAPNSPSEAADLRAGDIIYSFSGVTSAQGIMAIGPVVARSEGQTLTLLVMRDGDRLMLRLTPRSGWGGRGMLGCHILPV